MDSCSVNSCNVVGHMVESELRCLLYHFGHNSEESTLNQPWNILQSSTECELQFQKNLKLDSIATH